MAMKKVLLASLALISCAAEDDVAGPAGEPGSSNAMVTGAGNVEVSGAEVKAEKRDGWSIGKRVVPPPAGASDVLYDHIAALSKPNVTLRSIAPQARWQWDALIATAKPPFTEESLEQQFNVSIEQDTVGGVNAYWVTPERIEEGRENHLFVLLHGGGYIFGAGVVGAQEAGIIAANAGVKAISIDYRMPPEHPFPAALDDVAAVYRELLKSYRPESIAMGGTSAGSGLTLAGVHKIKSMNLPVPGALFIGTPWADMTKTGDTWHTNEGIDSMLVTHNGLGAAIPKLYANGRDLRDPLISPVYGDFSGFPPSYLVTGTRDVLLSDTVRTHRKMREAGVIADLNVFEGMSHGEYQLLLDSPESKQAYGGWSDFMKEHLE
ncbi:MAG: alpha/beta hydrolase [Pseudomonadota bacterium]